jgi:flagellar hook assembly protein FlgD
VEGVLTGAFDSIEVNGLAPGFEFEISATGGQLSLKALNNATTTNTDPLVPGSSLLAVGAYPNPFGNSTNISFRLEKESHVRIRVFTVTGAVVRTLEDGLVSAGDQVRTWDGRDNWGHDVSSGVYFCVVEGQGEWVTRKLVRVL